MFAVFTLHLVTLILDLLT